MSNNIRYVASLALICIAAGCGGGSNASSSPITTPSPSSSAQGVYEGTLSQGSASNYFEAVVLPDDKLYAMYGTVSGGSVFVAGQITGQGASNNGTYAVTSLSDYFYTGTHFTGSLTSTYSAGAINGTVSESGVNTSFNAVTPMAGSFNFNTPATLPAITGAWSGNSLDGTFLSINIDTNGLFAGGWSGANVGTCAYTGGVKPDSTKNFYAAAVTIIGTGCPLNGQTAPGVAVVTTTSTGQKQLFLAFSSPPYETVFVARR